MAVVVCRGNRQSVRFWTVLAAVHCILNPRLPVVVVATTTDTLACGPEERGATGHQKQKQKQTTVKAVKQWFISAIITQKRLKKPRKSLQIPNKRFHIN